MRCGAAPLTKDAVEISTAEARCKVSLGALDQPKALGSGPQNRGHSHAEP
jgi:hypothetical protein